MAVIDPEGLFGGDRLRRCSNAAQLHWPRLFLASNGFARIEINYARIVGRAYPTFNPIPSETELQAWIQEFVKNYLLYLYEVDGQVWGQWDTRKELLPKYKTAMDRRSPIPPEPAFTEWKRSYRLDSKAFPKSFENPSETFLHGVGVGVGIGVGKNICASDDARAGSLPPIDTPAEGTTPKRKLAVVSGLTTEQQEWFTAWWAIYWRKRSRKAAVDAFRRAVTTQERFHQVMAATKAQTPEMLGREAEKRPYGATWLNGERWEDEPDAPERQSRPDQYTTWEPPAAEGQS